MEFGSAWYPEHWPETRWPEDIRFMLEAGFTVARIGEFAWSTIEPVEGHFHFDWMDRAIDLLHKNGISVIIGTPTAAPPAWLTHHNPEVLAVEPNGRPAQHGNRCHVSPGNTTYHKYIRRIVEQLAKRYGQDERVIGWQIDNEYNRIDYSQSTHRQFQAYLKEKYVHIQSLNDHWSTAYWSQSYTDWNEIPIPVGPHNPGLILAFKQFFTKVWVDFQKIQIAALRLSSRPEQWITHNFMEWFEGFDHYEVAADLDFASWDWYIGTGHMDPLKTGAAHDMIRGLKRKNFWLMETQPGCVNWQTINNQLNKGESRRMAWHAVAHGADAFLYWQLRSAPGGQEQLHGCLLGADGNPRPFFQEAVQIGQEFKKSSDVLRGTTIKNEIALLHSYDSRWSINAQRHHQDFDPIGYLRHCYKPYAARNMGVDILSSEADLTGYKLVASPALTVLPDKTVENLTKFVEDGGTLVLTIRCGQKDTHNALFPARQPGPLRELAGVEIEDYYALEKSVPVYAEWSNKMAGESSIWAEIVKPLAEDVQILAKFGTANGWLDGKCACSSHSVGDKGGRVVVLGAWLNDTLLQSFTDWLIETAKISIPFPKLPSGVEAARRVTENGEEVWILINHNQQAVSVDLQSGIRTGAVVDVLTDERLEGAISIPTDGVRVLIAQIS